MENHTVVQLKAIAKEQGRRGYYKLRKAELIHALEPTRLVEQKSNMFDEPIPNNLTPVLQQHLEGHQMSRRKLSKILKISLQKTCKKQNKNSLLWVCKRLKILASGC